MLETIRVNSLTGKSIIIMLDKVVYFEESPDGEATLIHLLDSRTVRCMDDVTTIQEIIKRLAVKRRS